jgi:hypothetical protein
MNPEILIYIALWVAVFAVPLAVSLFDNRNKDKK